MDVRIHPAASYQMLKSADEAFGKYFYDILEEILTKDVVRQLCEERYKVMLESYDNAEPVYRKYHYDDSIQRFLNPDNIQVKKTFERLILCYAVAGVIPVTQVKLGEVIEKFLELSGGWREKWVEHVDAMMFKLPGSFEGGKRR